jgi:hypothetical protein
VIEADEYAPWPEDELRAVLGWHTQAARCFREGSRMRADHERRAKACANALASFDALRERCLLAETENTQLKRGRTDAA